MIAMSHVIPVREHSRYSQISIRFRANSAHSAPTRWIRLHEIREGEDTPTTGKELVALGVLPPPHVGERVAGQMFSRDTMEEFASELSNYPKFDRPILDKTGIKGVYLIGLRWYADGDITTAMQELLGLRLEPQRAPVDILIIDHVEKPSPN